MTNRLAASISPYLQQHADNPVDWWEWSAQAFQEARRRDVPVLLSVGYAACHWCHVMAHESFEDPVVAQLLNDRFLAIKVDREERPDIDAVYMRATQLLTGSGGWPMTVFLDHDARPFQAGTYYPPVERHGMPSFTRLLHSIDTVWRGDRRRVVDMAARVADAVRSSDDGDGPRPVIVTDPAVAAALSPVQRPGLLTLGRAAVRDLEAGFDRAHAGFGSAPKFPPSMVLEFLLRYHSRTGDEVALAMAERTCDAMARGGMFDQLGGGFARYSVDGQWIVPHFEKMLYDNALLARAYLHLWRATGSELGRRVAAQTCEFLLRELQTAQGGFASSLDADSDPVLPGQQREGAYYVWTPGQLADALGPQAQEVAGWLSVTAAGTFEHGTSVLQLRADPPPQWQQVRQELLRARGRRPAPARDDKVVAGWNGLAIAALAEAGLLLEEPDYLVAARRAAAVLVGVHLVDGRLRRVSRDGVAGTADGVLEDYAGVAEGLLALYQATGEVGWLDQAGALLAQARHEFGDPAGGFFDTAAGAQRLISRPRDPSDNAVPSGWTLLTGALLSYAALTGDEAARSSAQRSMDVLLAHPVAGSPRFFGWGLAVAQAMAAGPLEVAVVGSPGCRMHRTAMAGTSPGLVVAVGGTGSGSDHPALLARRTSIGGADTAYVCRGFTCGLPTTQLSQLAQQVR